MPQNCLIAAHDPWFIQLLKVYAEESGFQVVQAFEGQDVLPMMHSKHPAAVLLQVDLPGPIKGTALLQAIQSDPALYQIPVLVFSWQNFESEEDQGQSAATYLQEPVTYDAFVDALRKAGVAYSKL